jgi:HSP90 family molecular chaperone
MAIGREAQRAIELAACNRAGLLADVRDPTGRVREIEAIEKRADGVVAETLALLRRSWLPPFPRSSIHALINRLDDILDLAEDVAQSLHLYYVTADTFNAAANSPHLERLRAKNIEVILLHERIDGWLMSHLTEFDGKTFRDVARGDLDLGELETADEKQAREGAAEQASGLCARLKAALGDRVEDVRATERLAESASCLVRDENDYGLQMRRMMEAAGQALPPSLPVLEVNAAHPLLQKLAALPDGEAFNDLALVVQEQALLAEGSALPEPAAFVRRLNKLLAGN